MHLAYLSLGTNVGDRKAHLEEGVRLVVRDDAYRVSQVYETEPLGGVQQPPFWNLVVELTTKAHARELLERAHEAERARHRIREVRWGPRTLDVDVLLVADEISSDAELIVPHPRMYERRFVLAPLRELAPELVAEEALAAAQGEVVLLGTLDSLR
jgi:2-amino-4-hydroxy-6-hydroxymethyldihydropteridine diphosphokinase